MVVVWNNSPRVDMSLHSYTLEVQAYLRQSWYCGIASSFVLDHFNLIDLDFVARVPDTRALLRFNERHVFPFFYLFEISFRKCSHDITESLLKVALHTTTLTH
jgi:hypothetical protein